MRMRVSGRRGCLEGAENDGKMTKPENTSLWKAAFNKKPKETEEARTAREKLRLALESLRARVADILTKIPEDCKGLTLHDVAHADQLWDVASTICGPAYPINPAEGFVLGAAFLLHDAALTAAAYPGGSKGLKNTILYRDIVTAAAKRKNPDFSPSDETLTAADAEYGQTALFALLRQLHADRAEKLLDETYEHPILKTRFTLVDHELLLDLGEVIGQIAASHHWGIKRVDATFGAPYPAGAAYSDWSIDAVKLACILRAADACAIDERRARIMAFVLENPRGISRDHWLFQANLTPGHLPKGSDALVFRAKHKFERDTMGAWWMAYDAIGVADRELRACDRLLKRRAAYDEHDDAIPFRARRVEGANDTEQLATTLQVGSSWKPVDASARISDPARVIESLGGRNLYGNDLIAPIRELLQNAADAVRARRALGGYGSDAGPNPGRIEISVEPVEGRSDVVDLIVSDDGIGMSEDVLTGEFLDFGRSLWSSERLSALHPGLSSNPNFRPTGRFGIGFYSAFMLSGDIEVRTRPYRAGQDEVRVLHFANGINGRAELRHLGPATGTSAFSTQVIIRSVSIDVATRYINSPNSWSHRQFKFDGSPFDKKHYKRHFVRRIASILRILTLALDINTKFFFGRHGFILSRGDIDTCDDATFRKRLNLFYGIHRSSRDRWLYESDPSTVSHATSPKVRVGISRTMSPGALLHIGGLTVTTPPR